MGVSRSMTMRCSWISSKTRERLGMMVFATVFTVVYVGLHLAVFWRYAVWLGIGDSPGWVIAAFGGALIYPLAFTWEKLAAGTVSRAFYWLASVEMGVWWIACGWLLPFEIVRWVFAGAGETRFGWIAVGAVAATSVYALVLGSRIRVREIAIQIPKLERSRKLVHLTDLHCGTIHREKYLRRVVASANALQPDLVLITGDLFDGSGPVEAEMVAPLDDLDAPAFFCTGNHENYEGLDRVMAVLKNSRLRVLRNASETHDGLQIVGVNHPMQERAPLAPILDKIPLDPRLPTVLMIHAPSGMKEAAAAGIDLQLSGHSHWGQMIPFNLVVRCFYPHGFGCSRHGSLQLYCAPGSGTWGPPMRLGSRNEITLIALEPASRGPA